MSTSAATPARSTIWGEATIANQPRDTYATALSHLGARTHISANTTPAAAPAQTPASTTTCVEPLSSSSANGV